MASTAQTVKLILFILYVFIVTIFLVLVILRCFYIVSLGVFKDVMLTALGGAGLRC